MVFLLVLLTINSILSPVIVKEYFQANDSLEINVLKRCGRNLVFPYFGANNIFTAAQRALVDTSLSTMPLGKCPINTTTHGQLNKSFSIIHENSIFYNLKKSCLALNMTKYRFENNDKTLLVSLAIDSKENIDNISKFFLVNPLFVEFCFGTKTSMGYLVNNGKRQYTFSNALNLQLPYDSHTGQTFIDLRFDVAVPLESGDCDKSFNYKDYSPSQGYVTQHDMRTVKDGLLHMWLYYLDDLDSNFQKTGKDLPIVPIQNQQWLKIFDKSYKQISKDPYLVETYEFMNNFAVMYNNFIIPVMTFSFDIVVTADMRANIVNNNFQLFKCYMNNTFYGGQGACQNDIVQVSMEPNDSMIKLRASVGDNNECGYKSWSAPPIDLMLPYLSPNTTINITLTIGPNQKHLLAQWMDINAGDIGRKFVYAKSYQGYYDKTPFNVCDYWDSNDVINTNNMTKTFGSKQQPRPSLEDTYIHWNGNFVKKVNGVGFGYKNFNNIYGKQ